MLVSGTLGIRNTDLFELSSGDMTRTVSLVSSLKSCVDLHVCVHLLHVLCSCGNQAKIQVTKETLGGIPIWIIIISILMGLLILALVIFALWKVIFPESGCRIFQIFKYYTANLLKYAMIWAFKGIVKL